MPVSYLVNTNTCVAQINQTSFVPDGPACEIQRHGEPSHMTDIFVIECIDEIRITSFDQGGGIGGSYTTVFQEGVQLMMMLMEES